MTHRIRISGPATAWQHFPNDREAEEITDRERLPYFAGIAYRRESMCDYLRDGPDTLALADIGLTGGYIALDYDRASNALIAVTEYAAPRALNAQELDALTDCTRGQWSDGTGSNFGQSFAVATRVSIDIMLSPEEVKVEQMRA